MANNTTTQVYQRRALVAAVSAACAGGSVAHAQKALEEIVVTATKREVSMQDVPIAVTAFTDQDIVKQGFKTLDDYVGKIPGLAFSRREPGGTTVLMRGCTVSGLSFGDSSTTSIYLDEQPITAAGRNPDARLIDIQRVEALSGPQGTLFGDASECGALRIITNKPDNSAFDSWVDVGLDQVKSGDIGYSVSGMLNLPLVQDKLALRLVGFYEEEAGYIDNILSQSPTGTYLPGGGFNNADFVGKNVNSATDTGARAMLRFTPNDNWTVDLAGVFQQKKQDGFGDEDVPEGYFAGRDIGDLEQVRFNNDSWDDKWYQLSLTAEGHLGWADLTMTGSFFHRETIYEADATTYQFAFNELNAFNRVYYNNPYINAYDFGGDPHGFAFNKERTDLSTFEIRLSTPDDSSSRWNGIVGFFYNRNKGHTIFYSSVDDLADTPAFSYLNYLAVSYNPAFPNPAPPSDNFFTGVYDGTIEQTAFFGELGFDITDNFDITVGGRFYHLKQDRTLKQGSLFPVGSEPDCSTDFCLANATGGSNESGFVPKVTLDYHFTDATMAYVTYSEGFRRGGANAARATTVFGPGQPYNAYNSDTVKNFEIGVKSTFADNRFRLNATVYHMIWDNIQLQANDPDVFTLGIVNFPQAEMNGAEVQINWVPGDQWEVSGTLGWNTAEISKDATLFPGSTNPTSVLKGTQLPIMPDWKGSLSVEYTLGRNLLGGAPYVRVDDTYNGDATSSLEGIQSILFANPVRTLNSYNIVNLRFGVEADKWSAALYVDNLTDERAAQFYNDRWKQTRLSINRPLTFGITYRVHFN